MIYEVSVVTVFETSYWVKIVLGLVGLLIMHSSEFYDKVAGQ